MKTLNTLFLLCREQKITVSELSRISGINRTRLHRLVHMNPNELRNAMSVSEAYKIAEKFPNSNFNF